MSLIEKTFIFSGDFSIPREQLEEQVSKEGAKIATSFKKRDKKNTILCVGNNAKPAKRSEAQLLGVPVVDEAYIWEALKREGELIKTSAYSVFDKENKRKSRPIFNGYYEQSHGVKKRKTDSGSSSTIPKHFRKKVIALEGEIGVGKSTLSKKIQEAYPGQCSLYEEQTNEGFLKLFYGDPGKYGFAFQWGMLTTRIYQLHLAQHDADTSRIPKNKFFIWDRSMFGDYIFALWNHLQGAISKDEMDVYQSQFGGSILKMESLPFLKDIHCLVVLNDEPAECKFRVEEQRKNESEQGIPLPYYEGIDDMHFTMFLNLLEKKISKVVILNWGQYHDAKHTIKILSPVLAGKKEVPAIHRHTGPLPEEETKGFVYRSAEAIEKAYSVIKEGNVLNTKCKEIYIPQDVLVIDPKDKNVVPNDYGITFYENSFKRLVFWHLAQFHNIHFFKLNAHEE